MSKLKEWSDKIDAKYDKIASNILLVTQILFIIWGVLYLTIWSK